MKTVIEMADEVFDRMLPDGHCREPYWTATEDELKRFAELVRAAEREECAKVCEELQSPPDWNLVAVLWKECRNKLAAVIRARSNT